MVICDSTTMTVLLAKKLVANSSSPGDVHFEDETCVGHEHDPSTIALSTAYDRCLTMQEVRKNTRGKLKWSTSCQACQDVYKKKSWYAISSMEEWGNFFHLETCKTYRSYVNKMSLRTTTSLSNKMVMN